MNQPNGISRYTLLLWPLSLTCVVCLLYAIELTAPSPMATHFDLYGRVNASAPRSGFIWFMSFFILGLNAFYLAGAWYLPKTRFWRQSRSGIAAPNLRPIMVVTANFTNAITALALYWVLQENHSPPFAVRLPFFAWMLAVLLLTSVYMTWIFLLSRKLPR